MGHNRSIAHEQCPPTFYWLNVSVPGCECLLYTATYGKEYGTFSSPDYPKNYPSALNCLLYTFVASKDEIIEVVFKDFDVQKTHLEWVAWIIANPITM